MTYRKMSSGVSGEGLFYPKEFTAPVHCLFDVAGNAVRSVYARDPKVYGEGGPPGSQVCYRGISEKLPPRIPVPRSSNHRCLSIYDVNKKTVCFRPIPVAEEVVPVRVPETADEPSSVLDDVILTIDAGIAVPILPEETANKKLLVVGGVIAVAVVVLGGLAVATTKRKR